MNRKELSKKIKLEMLGTHPDTKGECIITCPACNGGTTGAECMAVNIHSGFFVCYRAKCGIKGKLNGSVSTNSYSVKQERTLLLDRVPDKDVLATVPEHIWDKLRCPVGTSQGRVVYNIYDIHGSLQGYVARSYTGVSPKALTYTNGEYCGLHFPRSVWNTKSVTLVEDIPSAEILNEYTPTAALLGSYIKSAQRDYLDKAGITVVYLALDEDASAKSIKQSLRYLSLDIKPVLLDKDPKDMTEEELSILSSRISMIK